jgi:glycosyltransferase involved in cell wall biosynthesis
VKVGAVIPVRGPAPFLDEAIAGVLAEGPDEVVVVDDGSPEPVAVAGVRVLRRETSGGPAAARNAGIAALADDVELVAFCDADDAWTPGSLAPRVAALAVEPAAALVFGRARVVGADGTPTGEAWPLPPAGRFDDAAALYAHNPILTSSVVIRRALARFDESYPQAEDWELWLRLLRAGHPLVAVPEAEVRYRRHPGGLTSDVAALARAQRRLHAAHGDLVGPGARLAALARDTGALWRARLRGERG